MDADGVHGVYEMEMKAGTLINMDADRLSIIDMSPQRIQFHWYGGFTFSFT